jgi:predicted MFS family arabinose efflux permease
LPSTDPTPRSPLRDLRLLWLAVFTFMFGFGIYSSVFFNFATEVIKIQPQQLGIVEAVRETPGFLCVLATALTMRIAEPLLGSMTLILVSLGMGAYAWVNGVPSLLVCSFVWSVGLHTWMPLQSSLVLDLAGDGAKGKRLGQTSGIGSLGAALGMALVMIVSHKLGYHAWFLIGSAFIAAGGLIMLAIRRDIGHGAKPRFLWKRKYSLYYGLTFLEGCRKQVFFTFAVYALTKVYDTSLRTVAMLMLINNVVNFFCAPRVGKLIDRIGERRILLTSYSALILVFIGYATIHHAHILYIMYCLDNLFYLSTNCLTTYLQKIAEPQDLMPTLSLGVTLNHTAAVTVPLIGGFLWESLGYPVTFFGGAVVVAISLMLATRVGRGKMTVTAQ